MSIEAQKITMDGAWQTREGEKARILCVDGPSRKYPVVGIVGDYDEVITWTATGKHHADKVAPGRLDLVPVPEPKRTMDVWLHWRKDQTTSTLIGCLPSPDDLARVKVTLTEGQFDDLVKEGK